jgi:hypothetical protein
MASLLGDWITEYETPATSIGNWRVETNKGVEKWEATMATYYFEQRSSKPRLRSPRPKIRSGAAEKN